MFQFQTPNNCDHPYTISEINNGIAAIIEAGNTLVWFEGEISNYKPGSSGHIYFRLKDEQSQIPAVMWRSTALQLKFTPEEGMAVIGVASIRVYQRGGYYQLDVQRIQPAGSGALFLAFEKLKKKLQDEGLFDSVHKKPLPQTIKKLGLITSKRGAAIRDMVQVVARRAPSTEIVLIDVAVQGEKAPKEIASAIKTMNAISDVEVIIVGRGGGSIEDLWAFNEEIVARAIFDSEIPIISAVGHEVDFTIADFVADLRAPTPSVAAELAVTDSKDSLRYFESISAQFSARSQRFFSSIFERYNNNLRRAALKRPISRLREYTQRTDELQDRFNRNFSSFFRAITEKMNKSTIRLHDLSPLAILSRGYSIISGEQGETIKNASDLEKEKTYKVRFHKGEAEMALASHDK